DSRRGRSRAGSPAARQRRRGGGEPLVRPELPHDRQHGLLGTGLGAYDGGLVDPVGLLLRPRRRRFGEPGDSGAARALLLRGGPLERDERRLLGSHPLGDGAPPGIGNVPRPAAPGRDLPVAGGAFALEPARRPPHLTSGTPGRSLTGPMLGRRKKRL